MQTLLLAAAVLAVVFTPVILAQTSSAPATRSTLNRRRTGHRDRVESTQLPPELGQAEEWEAAADRPRTDAGRNTILAHSDRNVPRLEPDDENAA